MHPSIHNDVLIPLELWVMSQSERMNPDGFSMSLEFYGEIPAVECRLFARICLEVIALLLQ